MLSPRWHIRLAGSVLLCLITVTVGCQSVRGENREVVSNSPGIPPLSAAPMQTLAAEPAHLSAAPILPVQGTSTSPGTSPPLIPALPTTAVEPAAGLDLSGSPGQRPVPTGSLPSNPSFHRTLNEATPATALQTSEACLPSEADWRKQMEEQSVALLKRLGQMEAELSSTRKELQNVQQSLQTSQTRMEQLNQEVTHWKGEVKRLETDMRTQQLSDLKALDELTGSMHQVLLRQRGHAPQTDVVQ